MANDGENRERTEKPEEDSKSQAPAHAGAIAAHVALEENSEDRADQQRHQEMHNYRPGLRLEVRQPLEQRQVPSGILPAAERQSTDGSGKSSSHDRTAPAKLGLVFLGAETSADSEDNTDRHAQANQASDKLGKPRLRVVQHGGGRSGTEEQYADSSRHHKPKKQRAAQAPDQTRSWSGGAFGKEKTEGEPKNSGEAVSAHRDQLCGVPVAGAFRGTGLTDAPGRV